MQAFSCSKPGSRAVARGGLARPGMTLLTTGRVVPSSRSVRSLAVRSGTSDERTRQFLRTRTGVPLVTGLHTSRPARPLSLAPAVAQSQDGDTSAGSAWQSIKVVVYVFAWYAFNIVFNILNKTSLNSFPAPWFISMFELIASGAFMCTLWVTGLYPAPRVSWSLIRALMPVALFHTIGHVSACLSFSQMAVSFAHVVKSAEPVLSVGISQVVLGEVNPWYVWMSLMPIIFGCSLAAMKEVSFAWNGFNNAMISNLGMVLRNVYSKKSLGDYEKDIDGTNLFGLLSLLSLIYLIPAALAMEGFNGGVFQWGATWDTATAAVGTAALCKQLALAGLFYHLYNQASYMVLGTGISPVTLSVGNTMKRVAVVVSSILFFKNPVSGLNWAGSLIAMLGTGLYSAAKQKASNAAKAAKAKRA